MAILPSGVHFHVHRQLAAAGSVPDANLRSGQTLPAKPAAPSHTAWRPLTSQCTPHVPMLLSHLGLKKRKILPPLNAKHNTPAAPWQTFRHVSATNITARMPGFSDALCYTTHHHCTSSPWNKAMTATSCLITQLPREKCSVAAINNVRQQPQLQAQAARGDRYRFNPTSAHTTYNTAQNNTEP